MGEAYLAGNQAHIALRRLERARDTFQGESAIPNFWTAVRLALAEAYGSVDVEAWDQALGCLKEILTVSPGEDRALALKARVLVRSGQRAAACDCAVQCLQSNPNNLEGLLYFAFLGFLMAKGAGNVNAMREAKHILIRAQSKCPGSIGMAWLLDICDIGIAEETDTA
jgi:tetratricopeptide (TPR) repeat protein